MNKQFISICYVTKQKLKQKYSSIVEHGEYFTYTEYLKNVKIFSEKSLITFMTVNFENIQGIT